MNQSPRVFRQDEPPSEDIGSDQTWIWSETHVHSNPTTTIGQWDYDDDDDEDDHHYQQPQQH